MTYILSFLEGIITFISPCLLPMLPVYILYFTGGSAEEGKSRKTLINALGFVLGFTLVFVSLGAFMAGLGSLLQRYHIVVNLITGAVVVVFGLNFMGVLNIRFLNGTHKIQRGKGSGIFLSGAFRHYFFYWLDALCGNFSRFSAADGVSAGIGASGDSYASSVFSGIRYSVSGERAADR